MLHAISISNYALISKLQMNFQAGFSVITGETGAGKSIILGALGLIMGQRADAKSISEGEQKCVIEANFDISAYHLKGFFDAHELDFDTQHCIIRRELTANGKSRCFVNDTPVTISILKELTANLIDIHSQHESLLLGSNVFQLNIVDTVAKNQLEKANYKTVYLQYKEISKNLEELKKTAETQKAEADYISFQYHQLADAHLQPNELASLEEELNALNHAEEIKLELNRSFNGLDNEQGVISTLKDCNNAIKRISNYIGEAKELENRLESTYIELKDIAAEISDLAEKTAYNPERQQWVEARVNLLYSLMQKHRLQTENELIALRDELESKMQRIELFDENIVQLEQDLSRVLCELTEKASVLSASRIETKEKIENQLCAQLKTLGIPHPQFEISFTPLAHFTESGADEIQFLFSANKNQSLKNVAQVASGGEISRLMLCTKALIASSQALPTIIFDEIDTGVSGEVADSMANIMQTMGKSMQVLSITHLPQIAAKGNAHYKVYKADNTTRTETNIKCLTHEERIQEIAQMLSGANVSEAAIENAKHLLN